MPRVPSRDKSVPRCAKHSAGGRHMRTLMSRYGRVVALLCSAHPTSPVCGPIRIRSTAARDVARRSRPITSETTAATPRATTMTTTRAPTVTTSASVRSDAANVLDFPVEYALLHPDDHVYPSSHSWRTCTQTTYRHVFCCEKAEHIVSSSTPYYTPFHANYCSLMKSQSFVFCGR